MIELPNIGDADEAMWTALLDIADRTQDWTLIGGQMVLLHGLEHARLPPRISEDLDRPATRVSQDIGHVPQPPLAHPAGREPSEVSENACHLAVNGA